MSAETKDSNLDSEDIFRVYLNEVDGYPLLSEEDEDRLIRLKNEAIKTRDYKLFDSIVKTLTEHYLHLVVSIARGYPSRGKLDLMDIIQEGNIGLMRGIKKFKGKNGCSLSTYVRYWIRGHILSAIKEQSRTVRIPISYQKKNKEKQIPRAIPLDYDEIISVEDESPLKPDYSEPIRNGLRTLEKREQTVLELRYGINGAKRRSLRSVGNNLEKKITGEMVRQIENAALEKLSYSESIRACVG